MANSAPHKGTLTVYSDGNAWLDWAGTSKFFINAADAIVFAANKDITLNVIDGGL